MDSNMSASSKLIDLMDQQLNCVDTELICISKLLNQLIINKPNN